MSRLLFLNLPVVDLAASRRFFKELGFSFDERFSDEGGACLVVSEQGYVMLLERERFSDFIAKPIADAKEKTGLTVTISAEDRGEVDSFTEQALAAGATPANDPLDYGFMFQRSFHDLDGHLWEVMWIDPVAAEKGPEEFMAEQA